MVFLGFGKYARADKIYALEPLGEGERGHGRRTRVWIEGVDEPIIASRTERTILYDMGHDAGTSSAIVDQAQGKPPEHLFHSLKNRRTASNALLTVNAPGLPGHFDLISVLPDGSVQLTMSGSANTNYTLLGSSNLASWGVLNLLSSSNGVFQYMDGSAAGSVQRFYRLKLGP